MKKLLTTLSVVLFSITLSLARTGDADTKKVEINGKTILTAEISSDRKYGYTEKKPIKVGGSVNGPADEQKFLNSLAGPNGEEISYSRQGSCCAFKTRNAIMGKKGFLDVYVITYEGLDEPVILYLNMYDPGGELKVPAGFTLK